MSAPTQATLSAEEDILILAPDAPRRDILQHRAGWDPDLVRCDELTGDVLVRGVPIPEGWATDPGYVGSTPNHSAAIVLPGDRLLETQPLHVCADGTVVSQHAPPDWRGSSIRTGGVVGNLGAGSHGGSGMTAFGGTIRLGEWVPRGAIRHVMKIEIDASDYLYGGDGPRFRWPASRADAESWRYGGDLPDVKMGALVTLPPSFDLEGLNSEPARILAVALQQYGAYVVDDAGRSTVQFATEWGPQGRVLAEFEDRWGFPLAGDREAAQGPQRTFLDDLVRIYADLAVVADNSPREVGGTGPRLAPWAPPLQGGAADPAGR